MAKDSGTVRMGPISLFALVILICLAVMAVLTVSTAQATYASSVKQESFTTDTYNNESAAQKVVKLVDETLYPLRQSGSSLDAALSALKSKLPNGAFVEDNSVYARFVEPSGRSLTISININPNLTYSITNWQATTQWTQDSSDENALWTGNM